MCVCACGWVCACVWVLERTWKEASNYARGVYIASLQNNEPDSGHDYKHMDAQ
jgi:hypothetical protein